LREERLGRDYKINVYERCQFTIPWRFVLIMMMMMIKNVIVLNKTL
jgi:hypothetical protein